MKEVFWEPPAASTATRNTQTGSTHAIRETAYFDTDNRIVELESSLEGKALSIFQVRHDVRNIREQPSAVPYRDRDGNPHHHTFDLLIEFVCSLWVVYAVKPKIYVEKSGLEETIDLIRRQTLHTIADEAVILTEDFLSDARVQNAREILNARRLRNARDCRDLLTTVSSMRGAVRVHDLLSLHSEPGLARIAMWNLIDQGVLKHVCKNPTHTAITDFSFVRMDVDQLNSALRRAA